MTFRIDNQLFSAHSDDQNKLAWKTAALSNIVSLPASKTGVRISFSPNRPRRQLFLIQSLYQWRSDFISRSYKVQISFESFTTAGLKKSCF